MSTISHATHLLILSYIYFISITHFVSYIAFKVPVSPRPWCIIPFLMLNTCFYSTYSAFLNDFFIAIVLSQREWAEAKKELQEERENVRRLALDRDQTMKNSLRQVEDMSKELTNALGALASAESRAAVAEVCFLVALFCMLYFYCY